MQQLHSQCAVFFERNHPGNGVTAKQISQCIERQVDTLSHQGVCAGVFPGIFAGELLKAAIPDLGVSSTKIILFEVI